MRVHVLCCLLGFLAMLIVIEITSVLCLKSHHMQATYGCRNSATFVTALYDIGRGNWSGWQRSFQTYLDYFSNVLNLKTELVIYCEKSTFEYLTITYGHLLHSKVHTVIKPFYEIEFEKYRQIAQQIMKSEEFRKDNELLNNPEGFSVDYILLMNNKLSFMKDAIRINIFNSSHFFWIDAGYGHGDSKVFPRCSDLPWTPIKLLTLNKTITYTALNNPNIYKEFKLKLHKKNVVPALSGEFFGGERRVVLEFYHLYNKVFRQLLLDNVVDDDQNVALFCYYEQPKMFNLVPGDWSEAFTLYGK